MKAPESKTPTCPVCAKTASPRYRPFCSRRSADVDLGRWLTGSYAVPADTPEELDEAAAELTRTSPRPL